MPVLPGQSIPTVYVNDLIKGAMRLIGFAGQTPTAEEMKDCLYALNSMISSWNNDLLMIYKIRSDSFTLVANQQDYELGTDAADWDIDRPLWIKAAKVRVSEIDYDVQVCTDSEFADIQQKSLTLNYPVALNSDAAFPISTVSLWPIPTDANTFILYTPQKISQFVLGDEVALPEGYEEALRANLAIRIAPEFGKPVPDSVVLMAREAMGNIKRTNSEPASSLQCEIGTQTGSGWINSAAFNSGGIV